MKNDAKILKGTVRGNVIELEKDSGLPDGQTVTVAVTATDAPVPAPGEGLRRSSGAWAACSEELDKFLEQLAQRTTSDRR